ncbi:MAG TPA: hypothetical protein VHB21_20170, partial [Minicystis sp.]|nr:hypothetical protein [Minicystis sp.]
MVLNVVDCRRLLSGPDFDLLLRLSRIPVERAEVDPVAIRQAACGHCGRHLLVVEGARAVVCESCGHTLDCRRAYP